MSIRLLLLALAAVATSAAGNDGVFDCMLDHNRTLLGDWKSTVWAIDSAGEAVSLVDRYTRREKEPGEFTFSDAVTGKDWGLSYKITAEGVKHSYPNFEVVECRGPLRGNGRLLVFRYSLPSGERAETRELAYSDVVHWVQQTRPAKSNLPYVPVRSALHQRVK